MSATQTMVHCARCHKQLPWNTAFPGTWLGFACFFCAECAEWVANRKKQKHRAGRY